jgi:2-oxoglutarate ferredoxin oxidoreductase subunit beta
MGDGLDAMKHYKEVSKVRHGANTAEVSMDKEGEIIVGKFIDRERPEYVDMLRERLRQKMGPKYVEAKVCL